MSSTFSEARLWSGADRVSWHAKEQLLARYGLSLSATEWQGVVNDIRFRRALLLIADQPNKAGETWRVLILGLPVKLVFDVSRLRVITCLTDGPRRLAQRHYKKAWTPSGRYYRKGVLVHDR